MIATLTGRVVALEVDTVVLEVAQVGFAAQITPATRALLGQGQTVTLHTSMVVREDSLTLFGFLSAEERVLFELLQTASGVGPRLAQAMLAALDPETIRRAVAEEDLRTLESVSGIGRKGAQRIVLELKDKIGAPVFASTAAQSGAHPWREQVHAALVGLGFSAKEASDALDFAAKQLTEAEGDSRVDVPTVLRMALRSRDRG